MLGRDAVHLAGLGVHLGGREHVALALAPDALCDDARDDEEECQGEGDAEADEDDEAESESAAWR